MHHEAGADPVSAAHVASAVAAPRRNLAEIVLGVRAATSRWPPLAGVAGGLAAVVAGWLALFALRPPGRPSPPPRPSPTTRLEISLDDVRPPVRPDLPPAPVSPLAASPRPRPPLAPRAATRAVARRPPIEAARVLTHEPRADEPVDLTADVFVAGTARQLAGGSTAPGGTSPSASSGRRAPGPPASGASLGPDGGRSDPSRPVSLAGESWSCPWPAEAEPLAIEEQTVLIRVVARSDGTAEAVTVLADPGHGFGDAASDCARRARFLPARNSKGDAVRATSPPIRVRFSR